MDNNDFMPSGSINKNITAYKITISIIFGLLGFAVNFHTIIFPFGEYTAAILFGLLFPMLITISWGWKYGLLSALAGGCQSMWWIWGPSNGYAIFFVVPPFTLWIMWHGLFASLRNKQKEPKWWLNKYIIEVPFRVLSTINLYALSRWAITLNPPPWSWASDAPNTIPMHFSNFVVIKQAVVGYIILLLADVLLNLGFVRRFFKLKEVYNQTNTGYIISTSLLIGVLFWLIDSMFGSLVFHTEKTFLELFALNVPSYNVFIRTVFILACLVGGLLTSKLLRKQRESELILLQSEKKLSQAVEGNSIPTFIIDKNHIVTHWNKACENLTGVPVSEMIGTKKHWSPFYSEERPVMADLLVDKLSEKDISKYYGGKYHKSAFIEGAYEAEDFFPNLGEDGKWLFFTAAQLRDYHGEIIGAIETLQDITERKKVEEELAKYREHLEELVRERTAELEKRVSEVEQLNSAMVNLMEDLRSSNESLETTTQQLGHTNKELEAFSYSVSHDLRAPLRAIDGFSRVLLEEYMDTLDEQGKHYLQRVRAGTQNMGQLIDDILNLSRIGRRPIEKKEIHLEAIAKETYKSLENEWKDRKIDFNAHKCPPTHADSHLIKSVFTNLISNSLKFTRDRKKAIIEIGSKTKDKQTVFFVKDNGVGFDMKYADKLFVPFQRLHSREEYEGSGIGLAIVQRIIHRHGGKIWAESKLDKGTTFYFTLPG